MAAAVVVEEVLADNSNFSFFLPLRSELVSINQFIDWVRKKNTRNISLTARMNECNLMRESRVRTAPSRAMWSKYPSPQNSSHGLLTYVCAHILGPSVDSPPLRGRVAS